MIVSLITFYCALCLFNMHCSTDNNVYTGLLQNISCSIDVYQNDLLSNQTGIYFPFKFSNIPGPSSKALKTIYINGVASSSYYSSTSGSLKTEIYGPLSLSKNSHYDIMFPYVIPNVTSQVKVSFYPYKSVPSTSIIYYVYSFFYFHAKGSITTDCSKKLISIRANVVGPIPENSSIAIKIPPYLKMHTFDENVCTHIDSVANLRLSFKCSANSTTMILYNAISQTITDSVIQFRINNVFCIQPQSNSFLRLQLMNFMNGKTYINEEVVDFIATSFVTPIVCDLGYYAYDIDCFQCMENCVQCSSASICQQCKDGYYFNGSSCAFCPSGCISCLNENKCKDCEIGYYLNGSCFRCRSECVSCSSLDICSSCNDKYRLIESKCTLMCDKYFYSSDNIVCSQCVSPCVECSGKNSCINCISQYYLDGVLCKPCHSPCMDCQSEELCTSCKIGYYLSGYTCFACPIGCAECSSLNECSKCMEGYSIKSSICFPICDSYCESCIAPSNCGKCIDGYYISQSQCLKCEIPNCNKCSSFDVCTECSLFYRVENNKCECDMSECKNCDGNTGGCDFCGIKYWYDANSGRCIECNLNSLSRPRRTLEFNLCKGQLTENGVLISLGYSGVGQYRNNFCSTMISKYGPLIVGKYAVTNINCAFNGQGNSRVLLLSPIQRATLDREFDEKYQNLAAYSEPNTSDLSEFSYTEQESAIILKKGAIDYMDVGDTIDVTITGCGGLLPSCNIYPHPIVGSCSLEYSSSGTNEFKVVFSGWDTNFPMSYSACITIDDEICVPVCNVLSYNSLKCNERNKYKLGSYNNDGNHSVKCTGRYVGMRTANFGEYLSSIDIAKTIVAPREITMQEVETYTSIMSLLYDSRLRANASKDIIPNLHIQYKFNSKCSQIVCENQGVCDDTSGLAVCKCLSYFSGIRCSYKAVEYAQIQAQFVSITSQLVYLSKVSDIRLVVLGAKFFCGSPNIMNTDSASNMIEVLAYIKQNVSLYMENELNLCDMTLDYLVKANDVRQRI